VTAVRRGYVEAYYDKQPIGLTASYELLSVRPLSDGIAGPWDGSPSAAQPPPSRRRTATL